MLAISALFGARNRLNTMTNQTAMYAQAPADSTRTAAGMLRTFTYPAAIASAISISLSFGHAATDADLHHLAVTLTAADARGHPRRPQARRRPPAHPMRQQ